MIDLGDGHFATWIVNAAGEPIGLAEHHEHARLNQGAFPKCGGGGYVAWAHGDEHTQIKPTGHTLVSGGPGDEEHLTITPSLWHRARDQSDTSLPLHGNGSRCSPHPGCHGYIRAGRWVDA